MENVQEKPPLLRKSRQREEILRVLRGTKSHPTADWIFQQVKQTMPSISLGTIYRNLHILHEAGDILELNFGSSLSRFDGRTDDHYHFLCEKCGRIRDVEKCDDVDLDATFAHQTGHIIHAHRLEFLGICVVCSIGQSWPGQ